MCKSGQKRALYEGKIRKIQLEKSARLIYEVKY
jgi:hypothetical protein